MANAHVQGTGIESVGSTTFLDSPSITVTAGNHLVVAAIGNKAASPPTFTGTPPSGNSNTYAQSVTTSTAGNSRVDLWEAKNVNAGATVVKITPNAASFMSIGVAEASGTETGVALGGTGTGGATGTNATTGTVTIATAGEILYGVVTQEGGATTLTPNGSFNQIFEDEGTAQMPINFVYQIVSSNIAVSWTLNPSNAYACVAASYKAAATAAAGASMPPAQLPNRNVGPMALRAGRRQATPPDTTRAPATDTNFGTRIRIPNNRVGPPVLRMLYRAAPFVPDTSLAPPASGNRLRRVICSGA